MINEKYKIIPGFKCYEASNLGNIRNRKTGRILKPYMHPLGYLQLVLRKNNKPFLKGVHWIVATTWIPNPFNLPQVNHKDENKQNNFVWVNPDGSVDLEKSNLEWISAKDNTNYGTCIKRRSKKIQKKLVRILANGEKIFYKSINEAINKSGYTYTSIYNWLHKKYLPRDGSKWEYT